MKFWTIVFGSLIALSYGAVAQSLNDLSPFETRSLDIVLRTVDIEGQSPGVFFDVKTPYSNPVICSINAVVPVIKNRSEVVFEVIQSDVVVFPNGAFDHTPSYRIANGLFPANVFVQSKVENTQAGAASCHGWTLGKKLPRRACLTLNPGHEQTCVSVRQAGKEYYPLLKNNLHLGDCGC